MVRPSAPQRSSLSCIVCLGCYLHFRLHYKPMIDHHLLQDIEFFELHDEDDRKSLAKVLDRIRLQAGARLFERGDRGSELFIVHSGKVELSIRDLAGEKIVL